MGMKGVSPLIASIILIGFTVAVGGIIGMWLTTLSRTQTGIIENIAEKQAKCSSSTLVIKEAKYNLSSTLVNVTVTHETGSEKLYNLTIEVSGGGKTSKSTTNFTNASDPFEPGQSYAVSVNTANGATLPPEYVRARSFCQDVIGVVGECKSGQPCMKQV